MQIYNTYLTTSEIDALTGNTGVFNSTAGKIFYKEGLIVITSLDYGSYFEDAYGYDGIVFSPVLYNNSPNTYAGVIAPFDYAPDFDAGGGNNSVRNITIKWNSTLTLYENEILCRIQEDEFNFTLNPSIVQNSENSQLPKEFIYNDEFGPYITTIGLYNENAELLAIGKLGGPIKKRSNVDLNIIVRFDQ